MSHWRLRGDYCLWLIVLLALALRIYHLAHPPWDYHNWRQTQTLMVARDFNRHGFNLLHPQLQWVSNMQPAQPSYFTGEFSIEGLVAASFYRVFGESDTLARIVVITFSLFGITSLYELLKLQAGVTVARLGAFIYALLPYHVFFGRVFMPDVPALSLALGGLLLLCRWVEHRNWVTLLSAAAITALAILQKLTIVFVGLPMLYIFWSAKGRKLFAESEFYWFAAIAAIPASAWYVHANAMAHQTGFAFVQPGLFGSHLESWIQRAFIDRTLTPLWSEAFSRVGLGLSIAGFLWPAGGMAFWLFRLWSVAFGLLLFLIPNLLSANYYYYSLLLPGGAALSALVLARLAAGPITRILLAIILGVFTIDALRTVLPLYQDDRAPRDLGILLNHLSKPEDLIAAESGGSPNILYFADRRGWNLELSHDAGLIRQVKNAGARYYADPSTVDVADRKEFFQFMDANFERLTPDRGTWPIYRLLVPPPEALDGMPTTEIRNPIRVALGKEAELVGASCRTLTQSPTAFQVISFWRYLTDSVVSLQRYVHVANAAGKSVYHSTLRPLSQRSNKAWKKSYVIPNETLVTLPAYLPKGKYRVWLGVLDPGQAEQVTGSEWSIGNGCNCAQVGEVEIQSRVHASWIRTN